MKVAVSDTPGLPTGVDLLTHLETMFASRGLAGLTDRLSELTDFVAPDMAAFELDFRKLPRDPRLVGRGASHLLDLGGKRLRPMCVMLAARVGSPEGGQGRTRGFSSEVLDLAIAVELVHSATLLHDDVVDLADTRRGAPNARRVYGNAASVFAGDWLLIEALRRVRRSRHPQLLARLFDTIEEMIVAESLQLENRGKLGTGREAYFRVIEGKTASVFRWAMAAGAEAGGLGEAEGRALEDYGLHFGVAFQAVDDLLDLTGDPEHTGKELFTDLREGKMSFPLIVALEREADLRPAIEEVLTLGAGLPGNGFHEASYRRISDALRRTRAAEACLELARERIAHAVDSLDALPESRARRALKTVAEAIVDRDL